MAFYDYVGAMCGVFSQSTGTSRIVTLKKKKGQQTSFHGHRGALITGLEDDVSKSFHPIWK